MNKEKFLNILNKSIEVKVEYESSSIILYYYDLNLLRQKKLNQILNQNFKFKFNSNTILFEQELATKNFWINYWLWDTIQEYYGLGYFSTYDLIKKWLNDTKFNNIHLFRSLVHDAERKNDKKNIF